MFAKEKKNTNEYKLRRTRMSRNPFESTEKKHRVNGHRFR